MDNYLSFNLFNSFSMSGSILWYLQRASAVINLIFILYLFIGLMSLQEFNFDNVRSFLLAKPTISLLIFYIFSVVIHSFIGLWTVSTDYLIPRTLGFLNYRLALLANALKLSFNIVFLILGLIYLLVTFFILFLR